jgi:tetratricopeptide (TPR) repeat protein
MQSLNRSPRDQGLLFFVAACFRSRFEVDISLKAMAMVEAIDPATPEGQAAGLINSLDQRQQVKTNFDKLRALAQQHRDRPLLMWMLAVQCRSLHRTGEGIGFYKELLAAIKPRPGPVLVHQTYANLLDEFGRYEEALASRNLAVKMEPAGWSYQGLAFTLAQLKRYEEADRAYAKAVELDPDSALYWLTWGRCLLDWGKPDAAIQRAKRATELAPRWSRAWNLWAMCLEKKRDLPGALVKYRAGMKAEPRQPFAYTEAERVLRELGRGAEADQVRQERNRVVAKAKAQSATGEASVGE